MYYSCVDAKFYDIFIPFYMEDNLYHPWVEPFKHQLYFLGNVAVQYFFLILSFYFSIFHIFCYLSISVKPCAHMYVWSFIIDFHSPYSDYITLKAVCARLV